MDNSLKHITCTIIWLTPLALAQTTDKSVPNPVNYDPTVESLKQAEIPEWFIDGTPTMGEIGTQNTTFEEMQVMPTNRGK